jgi:hypothetical protein
MCLPVHQRTDAVRLFEPRRYGAGKLPNVGVSEHGPYSSSDPTSSTSTARDVGVFPAARAPRLSLSETALERANGVPVKGYSGALIASDLFDLGVAASSARLFCHASY